MKITETMAQELSKDNSTKCGSMIIGPNLEIRSMGYNGFPRGINDEAPERHLRPEKYFWAEHSERNAIYNAARVGIPTEGCTILIAAPIPPCMDCTRAIIQSGIIRLVLQQDLASEHPTWKEHSERVRQLLHEGKIETIFLNQYGDSKI